MAAQPLEPDTYFNPPRPLTADESAALGHLLAHLAAAAPMPAVDLAAVRVASQWPCCPTLVLVTAVPAVPGFGPPIVDAVATDGRGVEALLFGQPGEPTLLELVHFTVDHWTAPWPNISDWAFTVR